MEAATVAAVASAAFTLLQPYLKSMAEKSAEKVGSEMPGAVGKLWNSVHSRLARKPAAQGSLKDLLANPADEDLQAAFRVQLRKLLEEDDEFARELQSLLAEAESQTSYRATLHGSGAVAQGPGAKGAGERGVLIEGGAEGSTIVTGDERRPQDQDE